MCCCMIHNIRTVCLKNLLYTGSISYRCYQHDLIEFRILPQQFLLNLVNTILIDIQNDQPLRMVRGDLPAQLAADRAAASGDQYYLVVHRIQYFFCIDLNRIPSKEVFNLYLFQLGYRYISVDQLVDSGQSAHLTAGFFTDIQYFLTCLVVGGRNGENDLINAVLSYGICNFVSASNDRYTTKEFAMTAGIIINNALNMHGYELTGFRFF